jgi:hypothetical protein
MVVKYNWRNTNLELRYISTNHPLLRKRRTNKGRKTKHMDHYAGPAIIIRQIGTRSFLIEYKNADGKIRTFQRDVGMLSLVPPKQVDFEPESIERNSVTQGW